MIFDYMIDKAVEKFRAIETGLVVVCVAAVVIAVIAVIYCIISMIGEWLDRRKGR